MAIITTIYVLLASFASASTNQEIYDSVANKYTDKKLISIAQKQAEKYINTFSPHFEEWQNQNPKLV